MKSIFDEKKVFSTKQTIFVALIVVAVITAINSSSWEDYLLKIFFYGISAILVVVLSAYFLKDDSKNI